MSGARADASEAPAEGLLLARRGMAQCVRLLDRLDESGLDAGGRRALLAGLAYEARDMACALAALRTGQPAPVIDNPARRLAYGVSLPSHALRYLFQHSGIHLDVEWRDLPGALWPARLAAPWSIMVADNTPMWRATALWRASLRLGGQARDVPRAVADRVSSGQVTAERV